MSTLTQEQDDALTRLLGPAVAAARATATAPAVGSAAQPDLLATWVGLSGAELRQGLNGLLARKDGWERQVLAWVEGNPLEAAFEFLAASSLAFYLAEKEANPRIKTYVDAFYYIATCASVGYADIFAATQAGRAIAALVMIVGPAAAARALDRPTHKSEKESRP